MLRKVFNIIVYAFAIIGAILMLGYVASKAGLTKNVGLVDTKIDYYATSRVLADNQNYIWL